MRRFSPGPSAVQVWSVEPNSAQITWGHLDSGTVTVTSGSDRWTLSHAGGPGAIEIDGLGSDTDYRFEFCLSDRSNRTATNAVLKAKTLARPPGEELLRVATISDLHVGTDHFGFFKTMIEDPQPEEVYSIRCARSAMAAAQKWGADLLIIKGDAVHHRTAEHYEMLARLVDEFPDMEMILLAGNHDVDHKSAMARPTAIGARQLELETSTRLRNLHGLRLITADTTIAGKGSGSIGKVGDAVLDLASGDRAGTPTMLACHHQFQRYRYSTHWPPGIAGSEAKPFLKQFARVAPRSLVTSGHTHRCRAYLRHSLQLTEVSSTSDYPGSWAGYIVTEAGITQTVRRIATPQEMRWLEYSKGALLGIWGWWSPGSLSDRCLSHWWEE